MTAFDVKFASIKKLTANILTKRDDLGLGFHSSIGSLNAGATPQAKLDVFAKWFGNAVKTVLVGHDAYWIEPYVTSAYRKGSWDAAKHLGVNVKPPFDPGRIALFLSLARNEVDGLGDELERQVVREVGAAISAGRNPAAIMRVVNERIQKVGVVRANAIVNVTVVAAHANASLDVYKNEGVTHVGINPEYVPAKLRRVKDVGGSIEHEEEYDELTADEWVDFNPYHVESGPQGGQFTTGGGGGISVGFVSPSVKSGMDLKSAERALGGPQQSQLRAAGAYIDAKVGIAGAHTDGIVGAWSDGAENSIMTVGHSDWDHMVLATVMKGHLAHQKAVLVFQEQGGGKSVLAHFEAKGTLAAIHKNLLKDGLENHTVVPHEGGAAVYVVDLDGTLKDNIKKASSRYGNPVKIYEGRADFTPLEVSAGTDREQRDGSRDIYERIIAESPVPNAKVIWKDVRDRWSAPTGQIGYRLTSRAILEEQQTTVKPNSVEVHDVAKALNDRAGAIIHADQDVDRLDLDNRSEQHDDYIANVIAMDLIDGLKSGRSGADWYDKTMLDAMETADKLYPGVNTDPDKKFLYTAALAITSQGEVVDASVRLADEAYLGFKNGVFPVLKASVPNINENFGKINDQIKKLGSIAKVRELFATQMPAKDLAKLMGKKLAKGIGAKEMVYGSAMLGPKIGQGFYQNLNGNFKPITMDLWFMRSWGRVTNTGIGTTDTGPVFERFTNALTAGGMPVPDTQEKQLELARSISKQHDSDYKTYRKEFDNKTRVKSKIVRTAERVLHHAGGPGGAMVEHPEGVHQRAWITEVFTKAINKVKERTGAEMSQASAQATWWWPEKVLYDEMGASVKELDTDYAKSLRNLAKSRGLSDEHKPKFVNTYAPWIEDDDEDQWFEDQWVGDEARITPQVRHAGTGQFVSTRYSERTRARLASRNIVEIATAGDDAVCDECQALEDANPYTIDEAMGLVPVHVNCRCSWVPAGETEDDTLDSNSLVRVTHGVNK
jgi:hypothetical protein